MSRFSEGPRQVTIDDLVIAIKHGVPDNFEISDWILDCHPVRDYEAEAKAMASGEDRPYAQYKTVDRISFRVNFVRKQNIESPAEQEAEKP